MNKKNIAIIIGIIIIIAIGGIIFASVKSNNNDIQKSDNDNLANIKDNTETSKKYALIEDLPKYNNYNYYEIKDAVNQSWFSQIGEVGKIEQGGPTNDRYSYTNVTLGYDSKNKKEYLYPDAIILQGRLDGMNSGYGQTIIKKDEYATDNGYTFFENALKKAKYESEEINSNKEKLFKLTEEDAKVVEQGLRKISPSKADEYRKKISVEHYDTIQKELPWNLYDYMATKNFKMSFHILQEINKMSEIIAYDFNIEGGCSGEYAQQNGDGKYRIILVYDKLKANVNITYNVEDEIKNYANFTYYSGIINEDAYNKIKK